MYKIGVLVVLVASIGNLFTPVLVVLISSTSSATPHSAPRCSLALVESTESAHEREPAREPAREPRGALAGCEGRAGAL